MCRLLTIRTPHERDYNIDGYVRYTIMSNAILLLNDKRGEEEEKEKHWEISICLLIPFYFLPVRDLF